MAQWIISVCSAVLLTAIVGIIAPSGKVGGIVKCVFSLISVLIFIKPIFNIVNSDFNVNTIFWGEEIELQEDFINYTHELRVNADELDIKNLLEKNGIEEAIIDINAVCDNAVYKIEKVKINLQNAVIKSDKVNININDEVTLLVAKFLNVDKKIIYISGINGETV